MAIYADISSIVVRRGKDLVKILGTLDHAEDTASVVKLNTALDDAQNEVDSYVKKRHDDLAMVHAIKPPPPQLAKCTVDIAIHNLATAERCISTEIIRRYENCIKWLSKLAIGKVSIGIDDPPDTGVHGELEVISVEPLWTREQQAGMW